MITSAKVERFGSWRCHGLIFALLLGLPAIAQQNANIRHQVLQLATTLRSSPSAAADALEKLGEELLFGAEISGDVQAKQVVHRFKANFLEPLQEVMGDGGNTQVAQWLGPLNGMPPVPGGRAGWAAYAALWLQSRSSASQKNLTYGGIDFYRELAGGWSHQPEQLIPWLNRLKVSFSLDLILSEIVSNWAEKDPGLAAKYLARLQARLPESNRLVAQHWISRDPKACVAWLDRLQAEAPDANGVKGAKSNAESLHESIIEPWFEADPKAALSWFPSHIPSRTQSFSQAMALHSRTFLELLTRWLNEDPMAVTAWALERGNPDELVRQIALVWIETNPLTAITWVDRLRAEGIGKGDHKTKTLALAILRFRVLAPAEFNTWMQETQPKRSQSRQAIPAIPAEDQGYRGQDPYFHYLSHMVETTALSPGQMLQLKTQQEQKQARERDDVKRLAEKHFDSAIAWLQDNPVRRRVDSRHRPSSVKAWPLHATETVFSLWAQQDVEAALLALDEVERDIDALPALFFLGKNWPKQRSLAGVLKNLSRDRQSSLLMGLALSTPKHN